MEEEAGVLKEGFLVKRGHVVRNWKVRWFVLLQDKLLYYKIEGGKKEPSPKGRILLDGCTITCPCLEYENRPLLIKLKTKTNTDYFLECCSREERDSWALDITGAIHAGHPVQVQELHRMKNSFKLLENISLHNIVERMYDSSTGIKLTRNLDQGNRYKETFTGTSGRQRATSHLICHVAGTRELLYCLNSEISSGPLEPGIAAKLSNTFLALWMYGSTLRTSDFWSTLHFSDNLWDGAKMFLQVKTCVVGDHLPSLRRAHCLGMRAAFLPAGSALVDWLISNGFAVSRFEAVTLASMLMDENFIRPVGVRSTEATRSSDLSEKFLDDSTALYMFAESSKKNTSSKEEVPFNISELSGTIVKQGFLVKQGHKRKNWKVRKFVLRADPAFLHYYDPTKEDNKPVGGFSLRGCLVSALEDNGVPAGVKGNVQGNLFKIITKNDIHYYIQASSKAERVQWIEAIKPLT